MVRLPTKGTAAGRGMGTKMKTADDKSMSSQQWIKRQLADKWSERARAEGWRSRAAFKLIEIDDRFHLIKPGSRVIDLGAAPGGWAQVAGKRGAGAVGGVELLPVEPVGGATMPSGPKSNLFGLTRSRRRIDDTGSTIRNSTIGTGL